MIARVVGTGRRAFLVYAQGGRRPKPKRVMTWAEWQPAPFAVPVAEIVSRFTPPAVAEDLRGPTLVCSTCGSRYSSSPSADAHLCKAIEPSAPSLWDPWSPDARTQHRARARGARARLRSPHVLVSTPVPESVCRRRCYVCRRIEKRGPAGRLVTIPVLLRTGLVHLFRHEGCRGTISAARQQAGREGTA